MSKLAQDINSVGAELFEGRLGAIDTVDAELVQETQALVLTSPANGETGVALSATFTWTDSESRGLYRLVYDTDINFGSPTVVWTETTSHNATLTSGTYYWKVEAHTINQQNAFVPEVGLEDSVEGDLIALQALYDSTDGANWIDNTGWTSLTTSNMGDAYGVNVDGNGRVIHIDLQRGSETPPAEGSDPSVGGGSLGNNLVGTLPDELGNLTKIQYFNVKQNLLTGSITSKISRWTECKRVLLSGHTREPEIGAYNHPEGDGAVDGKTVYATNVFSGAIPEGVKDMTALEVFESQQNGYNRIDGRYADGLSGQIPNVWPDGIKMILLDSNEFTGVMPELANSTTLANVHINGGSIGGELPASWSNFGSTIRNFRLSSHNLTGTIPSEWVAITDLRFLLLGNNNLTGSFPDFLFTDGKNAQLNTLRLENNSFSGVIPEIPTISNKFDGGVLSLSNNNFSGSIPSWMSDISPQQFGIDGNSFSGSFPAGFHDQTSDIYTDLRYFRALDNQLTGSLPQVNFRKSKFSGLVSSNNLASEVTTDIDGGVLYTGTIDTANSGSIGDSTQTWRSDIADDISGYEVTVIVPGGTDLVFINRQDIGNNFLYSFGTPDLSGTLGYTYEIRANIAGSKVMFTAGQTDVFVREISSVNDFVLTLDSPIADDISGYDVDIYSESTNLLYVDFSLNQFSEHIPVQWAGIRTTRTSFNVDISNNLLSGRINPKIDSISANSLSDFNVTDNVYVPENLYEIVEGGFTELTYSPQKQFGDSYSIQVGLGSQVRIDEYSSFVGAGDTVQWLKNGTVISGETGTFLDVSIDGSGDYGFYQMRITRSSINLTVTSKRYNINETE